MLGASPYIPITPCTNTGVGGLSHTSSQVKISRSHPVKTNSGERRTKRHKPGDLGYNRNTNKESSVRKHGQVTLNLSILPQSSLRKASSTVCHAAGTPECAVAHSLLVHRPRLQMRLQGSEFGFGGFPTLGVPFCGRGGPYEKDHDYNVVKSPLFGVATI